MSPPPAYTPSGNPIALPESPSKTPTVPSQRGKVHALLALDTADATIGTSVGVDKQTMTALLSNIPTRQLAMTTLDGPQLTYDAVFGWLTQLRTQPDDTVFVYFSGHGATDAKAGHCLNMPGGRLLERWKLLDAAKGKRTKLTVLITDCCAVKMGRQPEFGALPVDTAAVVRKLLLGHRGVVDLNACEVGQFAYCNEKEGGYFTSALALQCELAGRTGKAPTWSQLFPRVVAKVEEWAKLAKDKQTPAAMTPLSSVVAD